MAFQGRGKQVSREKKYAISEMVRAGISLRKVATFYNISRDTVASIIRRNQINNSATSKHGRNHMLTERCIRRLIRCVVSNRFKPLFIIANEFRTMRGSKISVRTIRRYLHKNGIYNYAAVSKPYLSRKHMNARLIWANIYGTWSTEQWSKVAFSDESAFKIKPTSLRMYIWRKPGTRYETCNMLLTFKSGYVTVSVWAAFSMSGLTPLARIEGTLNKDKYRNVLDNYLLSFANMYHGGTNGMIFQHDNCGPHRANSIKAYIYIRKEYFCSSMDTPEPRSQSNRELVGNFETTTTCTKYVSNYC